MSARRQKYTCEGVRRGPCGAQHRTLDGALECCGRDLRADRKSDRSPVHTDGSGLTDDEKARIQQWEETP